MTGVWFVAGLGPASSARALRQCLAQADRIKGSPNSGQTPCPQQFYLCFSYVMLRLEMFIHPLEEMYGDLSEMFHGV